MYELGGHRELVFQFWGPSVIFFNQIIQIICNMGPVNVCP